MTLCLRSMKRLATLLLLAAFAACDKRPTVEETEALEQANRAAAAKAASPSPTPGNWMWKDYKNPLSKKPTPVRR